MGLDPNIDLRAMVREVLREAVAARGKATGVQTVTIHNDADLQAFIVRLATPGAIEAVRAGSLKFSMGNGASSSPACTTVPVAVSVMLDGVVSERKLQGLASGTIVRLAATAVLTPMAKDAARRMGLKFERIAE